MKYTKKILTLIFATILFMGLTAFAASAQSKSGNRTVKRPVVVKRYYIRHYPHWYWNSWYNPYYYYDPYFYYDPYLEERRQRYYLERELRGNQEELRKHLKKYKADGVLTAKEREELEDDYRDVERAQRRLNEFNRRRW